MLKLGKRYKRVARPLRDYSYLFMHFIHPSIFLHRLVLYAVLYFYFYFCKLALTSSPELKRKIYNFAASSTEHEKSLVFWLISGKFHVKSLTDAKRKVHKDICIILQGHSVSQENIKSHMGKADFPQTSCANLIWSRKVSWIQWPSGEEQQATKQSSKYLNNNNNEQNPHKPLK